MAAKDPVLALLREQQPKTASLDALESGNYLEVLTSWPARKLFHHEVLSTSLPTNWSASLSRLVHDIVQESRDGQTEGFEGNDLLIIGLACLHAFLQANVTGPPLGWRPSDVCLPRQLGEKAEDLRYVQDHMIRELSVDGEAVYRLIPHVELFRLAVLLCNHPSIASDTIPSKWSRLRVNGWHQRLLSEVAPSLQAKLKEDLEFLNLALLSRASSEVTSAKPFYLLERASIHLHQAEGKLARQDLQEAQEETGFRYVLTGRLGKRTKFQTFDTSQLVVLAESAENVSDRVRAKAAELANDSKPETIDLNDDTLLEKISFTKESANLNPKVEENVPAELQHLDPEKQQVLQPLDSILLLSLASSITNTSPADGLTREETLPYATRVLEGGSSNWQIYSQALLVRSRVEAFRSRTVERGVLQMQALVDQVIAETAQDASSAKQEGREAPSTTFLPRPKPSESAPATERLLYIHPLASPAKWTLEAELAEKWVSVGGLRTALEIYERLEMWAEAALCYASLEDENKARAIIEGQLYSDAAQRKEMTLLPNDAPRLFCILGDLGNDPTLYERAWVVSNNRFARAQRSLGKYYFKKRDLVKANESFAAALAINPQNTQTWFTLGCVRLELQEWKAAVEAFSQVVQREPDDAEAWSNLAASLLRLPLEEPAPTEEDEEPVHAKKSDPQKHVKQAFAAFLRAAKLKRESYRIWQNVLNVAATLSPPPYNDIIIAQQRIIELRGPSAGESCIDIEIMEGLLAHVIRIKQEQVSPPAGVAEGASENDPLRARFSLEYRFVELMTKYVTPLITHSRRLWQLVARLNVHLNRPGSALDSYEKAWRVTLNQPGWDNEAGPGSSTEGAEVHTPEETWLAVVESTVELVDAYESLGEREVTEGLGAGSGELVCKNWKYKARMAIRSVIGRRTKAGLEGTERLQERMEMLKVE